ncbi:tRNA (adenine(22)-N(1))-methyltransferase [Pediococcus claussenii]|uniref:tRNA (Adenine-N(1)-)-methyltransferase TrmK n=1 Tax=Pediococcus claussenii (strain ATCC BAA-344 / DSM 14800 / JCM 18046 / KCTC 3811 / LMG 21948 / P06) TaxID=701521 RepID=G8PD23_PEDCP|nr:tRNA (adenine(22)-N(1))-methyltransferase TrmK [Pediococcus claussenii]AEV95158.1 tRNA (adenine-N(1)-)-methyltransferase TrmK [Pediococcus claussenii ATCC BAA-344]ANZ70392.1 SAM-dependent methyltransferase [Pediococcus claussenii]ANZ72208.1 SAM-dependent methyltransferase [Pediococcus claussenii]KRN19659.1 trmK protein [Pediococcus claussenii]
MNGKNLSPRLKKVSSLVPSGVRLADIGSDHAYLPINLVLNKRVNFAVAGEVAEGPFLNSKSEIQKSGLSEFIIARLGNGLEVIQNKDHLDAVSIAGMGGILISNILEAGIEKLSGINYLVLQPNVGELELRNWLQRNHFKIVEEHIVAEDFHVYEMLLAVPGEMALTPSELKFGPILMRKKSDLFIKKWNQELSRLSKIKEKLSGNADLKMQTKLKNIETEMQLIQEVLS